MTMNAWKKMPQDVQGKLRVAIEELTDDIWKYSEELWSDGLRCNTGQDPCTSGKKYVGRTLAKPTAQDIELVKTAVRDISFPAWAEGCDKSNPGCSATWKRVLGASVGIK